MKKALESRLGKYDLQMNKDKSKMISFSKYIFCKHGIKQDTFDFLGFTFYICKTNKLTLIKQKTCGQKFRAKLKRVNLWCKTMRNRYKLKVIWRTFQHKTKGTYPILWNI